MSVASRVRGLIDGLLGERPPEAIIYYGPYDAVWPTVGGPGFCYFCHWCRIPSEEFDTLPQARRLASVHAESHPEVTIDTEEVQEP